MRKIIKQWQSDYDPLEKKNFFLQFDNTFQSPNRFSWWTRNPQDFIESAQYKEDLILFQCLTIEN